MAPTGAAAASHSDPSARRTSRASGAREATTAAASWLSSGDSSAGPASAVPPWPARKAVPGSCERRAAISLSDSSAASRRTRSSRTAMGSRVVPVEPRYGTPSAVPVCPARPTGAYRSSACRSASENASGFSASRSYTGVESSLPSLPRSATARWRENDSHQSSATGRTPVRARKANRRVRNDIAADLRGACRRCTRLLFDCRAALAGAAISGNGGKRAPVCAALLPALRMPRERQVFLQQALDPSHVLARARLPRAPHLVEDALAGEQHLAPGALARHQAREELQAAPAQVLGRLPNARFQHLDRRARIGLVLGPVIERLALLEAAQPGHGGGALEVEAHLLDRVLDPLRDHVQVLERLLQVVDRAQPERLDGRFGGGVAGHHDERA